MGSPGVTIRNAIPNIPNPAKDFASGNRHEAKQKANPETHYLCCQHHMAVIRSSAICSLEVPVMPSELRPLSLGELLDRSFFLYRKHFTLFVGITALPYLVLLAFQLAGVALQMQRGILGPILSIVWTLATIVVSLGVMAASQGATVIAVSYVHLERPVSIAESFAGIKGKVLYLALITIGYGTGVVIGFIFLIIPGIILALMWALTVPVAVLEGKGLRESVGRSAALTKGHRGRVFLIYLLFVVLTIAVYLLWEIPIFAAIGLMTRNQNVASVPLWTQIAVPLCTFLSQCLVGPLMMIGLSLLYYDERVRKEAFDLQHMMATLDMAPGGALPAVGV
jgi:hypothetical protein